MATIAFKGNPVHTCGELPAVGAKAPDFKLVNASLEDVSLAAYKGKRKILSVFPSIDTPVCALSVKRFNEEAAKLKDTVVLNISADLPFAQKRFCAAEGIRNVETLSCFRGSFAKDYGLQITDTALAGLCCRCVLVLDKGNKVLYAEQVPEITQEPNYAKALAALK